MDANGKSARLDCTTSQGGLGGEGGRVREDLGDGWSTPGMQNATHKVALHILSDRLAFDANIYRFRTSVQSTHMPRLHRTTRKNTCNTAVIYCTACYLSICTLNP